MADEVVSPVVARPPCQCPAEKGEDCPLTQDECDARAADYLGQPWFGARLRKIWEGFVRESANGVVCSIPDTGLNTPPHRTWCVRCQRRYMELKALVDMLESRNAALVLRPEPRAQEPQNWTHEVPWAARSAIIAAGEFGLEPTMQPVIDELRRRMKAATATDSSHVAAVITRLMPFVQHTSACLDARPRRECGCGAAKAMDDARNIACSLAPVLPASAPSLEVEQWTKMRDISELGAASARPHPLEENVTRFEVIEGNGRVLSRRPVSIELHYQDDGRTLKVFVKPRGE